MSLSVKNPKELLGHQGILSPSGILAHNALPALSSVTSESSELAALLGPLVSPLLQNSQGALDLERLPTGNYLEFHRFLITQVETDGIAFNGDWLDSYHGVLNDPQFEILLRHLYEGGKNGLPKGYRAKLKTFTASIIQVSAERFATHHLRSPSGRARLARILKDSQGYNRKTRTDLVKGIAQAAKGFGTSRAAYRKLNTEISVWNYTNSSVTQGELKRATEIALGMLQEVEKFQGEDEGLFERYLKHPDQVTRFRGLEKELQRTLSDTAIQEKAAFVQFNQDRYDPKTVLAVKLDELWLTLIDEDRWKDSGSLKTAVNAAFLIQEIEACRSQLKGIQSETQFLQLAERVRTLLKGGLGVTGEGTWRSIKDFTAIHTVAKMFQDLPEGHRSPYDGLLQYVEEIHHAQDMGENLDLNFNESPPFNAEPNKNPDQFPNFAQTTPSPLNLIPNPRKGSLPFQPQGGFPPSPNQTLAQGSLLRHQRPQIRLAQFSSRACASENLPTDTPGIPEKIPSLQNLDPNKCYEAKTQLIHGLKQTKRSLWYQYKQHKALSRGLSQAAKLIGRGDVVDIQKGQGALDQLIRQTQQAADPEQLKQVIQNLQGQLGEKGQIHQAMVAAEMDGTEQLIGLGQTILIILGSRHLGRGLARLSATLAETSAGQRVTQMAQNLKNLKFMQGIQRDIQNNVFSWRATKGFALGSWLATAENLVAAASDEVKPEGHHLDSWALDAAATGLAMGAITTTASYMGSSLEKNLFKRMLGRYFGSARAPLRIGGDFLAETLEEVSDAAIRGKFVDSDFALGFDQFREIAMVSGLGGFTKTGLIAEMLRGPQPHPNQKSPPSPDSAVASEPGNQKREPILPPQPQGLSGTLEYEGPLLKTKVTQEGIDFHWFMGRVLHKAELQELGDFLNWAFPKQARQQLEWLQQHRPLQGLGWIRQVERLWAEEEGRDAAAPEMLFQRGISLAQAYHAYGESKQAMDILGHVFYQRYSAHLNLIQPSLLQAAYRLLGQGIYPYFLGSLDPNAETSRQIILQFETMKKREMDKIRQTLKLQISSGIIALINSETLDLKDRTQLLNELVEPPNQNQREAIIDELIRNLKHGSRAPLAADLLEKLKFPLNEFLSKRFSAQRSHPLMDRMFDFSGPLMLAAFGFSHGETALPIWALSLGAGILSILNRGRVQKNLEKMLQGLEQSEVDEDKRMRQMFWALYEDFEKQGLEGGVRREFLDFNKWLGRLNAPFAPANLSGKFLTLLEVPKTLADQDPQGPWSEDNWDIFVGLLRAISEVLNLPENTFYLETENKLIVMMPPLEFWFQLPKMFFGDRAFSYERVGLKVSETQVHDLVKQGKRPLSLSNAFQDMHSYERVHPFLMALHDVYHTLRLSRMPLPQRQTYQTVYNLLQEFRDHPPIRKPIEKLSEILLDGTWSDPAHLEKVWLYLKNQNKEIGFLSAFALSLYPRLKGYPHGQKTLAKMLNEFQLSAYDKSGQVFSEDALKSSILFRAFRLLDAMDHQDDSEVEAFHDWLIDQLLVWRDKSPFEMFQQINSVKISGAPHALKRFQDLVNQDATLWHQVNASEDD